METRTEQIKKLNTLYILINTKPHPSQQEQQMLKDIEKEIERLTNLKPI